MSPHVSYLMLDDLGGGGRYLLAVDTQVQTTFYKMHFVKRKISVMALWFLQLKHELKRES